MAILQASDLLHTRRIDWREREFATQPLYTADRAQAIGVARADIATAIALATDGLPVGSLREDDRDIPIVVRTPRGDMTEDGRIRDQIIFAPVTGHMSRWNRQLTGSKSSPATPSSPDATGCRR